eukprot:632873-Prorocentrum_lima.AAC.1
MTSSLVGSEMCIRDRPWPPAAPRYSATLTSKQMPPSKCQHFNTYLPSVSYTHLTLPTICSV